MIESIARSIWIFDFDGTVAPIVADRNAAQIHPACRELLMDLVQASNHFVAILSSRKLDDIISRIDIPGIYIGGHNGLKWMTPQGCMLDRTHFFQGDLQGKRKEMMPLIMALQDLPGLEIEDKDWSVTLHLRRMSPPAKQEARERINQWRSTGVISLLQGPEAWEISFSSSFDKTSGVEILCRELDFKFGRDHLIYAGDDENDARAMKAITALGGTNITVGSRPRCPGCIVAKDPAALAVFCREMIYALQAKRSEDAAEK